MELDISAIGIGSGDRQTFLFHTDVGFPTLVSHLQICGASCGDAGMANRKDMSVRKAYLGINIFIHPSRQTQTLQRGIS